MISIDEKDLVMIILNGNLNDSKSVPLHIGEILLAVPNHEEHYKVIKTHPGNMFYTVWTAFGWKNELLHREYITSLSAPSRVIEILPPKKTFKMLNEDMALALEEGNVEKILLIRKQIKELNNNI